MGALTGSHEATRAAKLLFLFAWLANLGSGAALAHHTYAMFDGSHTNVVTGTVAKVEWKNPHVFVWVYVPDAQKPGASTLWAFENGSPSVLSTLGWDKDVLKYGEQITIEFWPLKDGKLGGHFKQATTKNGHVLKGAGGPGQ